MIGLLSLPLALYGVMTRCLNLIGDRRRHTIAPRRSNPLALPGNAFVAIRTTIEITGSSPVQIPTRLWSQHSEGDGASAFASDPARSSQEQAIFWAPEVLPTIIPVVRSSVGGAEHGLRSADLSASEFRQASDGWHVLLRLNGVEHRFWLEAAPEAGDTYAVVLRFDRDFEVRAHAARRFWRALNGRAAGPAFHQLTSQRRQRLALALCALDAWAAGRTYREIASVLFGAKRIPERAWKTHDLRNRTIRLVQSGIALMRGGYRQLLRPSRRKK